MDELAEILLAPESTTDYSCSNLPQGVKENVYFVVDNTNNISKWNRGKKSMFPDNCGAWSSSGLTKKHHYIYRGGSLVYTELKKRHIFEIFWWKKFAN